LLGIDLDTSHEFEREIARGCEGIKPGWVRVNFNYFISEETFEFILEAVRLVADEGWRLLPRYRFDPATALWHHREGPVEPPLSLDDITYTATGLHYRTEKDPTPPDRLADYLDEARRILLAGPEQAAAEEPLEVGPDFEHLRWFHLPGEVVAE
jgi:hypothetical protein